MTIGLFRKSKDPLHKVLPADIDVRNFTHRDIEPLVKYWTENSEEFWRARGVDKAKLKPKDEFTAVYEKALLEKDDIRNAAVIVFRGDPIGVHALTDIVENESAIFHAHIWYENYRGLGIGVFSYLKASEFFMKKLNLKKIIFKTPKINKSANRIKEKIGIPCLGDTIFEAPILIEPLKANLYEIDEKILSCLKNQHGLV